LWTDDKKSKYNTQLWEWIQTFTDEKVEYEYPLEWYLYDIKVWKFLIEVDPTRTHNSSVSYFKNTKPKNKYYHQKKSLTAEQHGFHCIHLFEWDNNENVKQWLKWLISKRKRLYHWEIREIDKKTASAFYNANHLQGKAWASIHYWLFVKWELINAMSFTYRSWERFLERFASLQGYRIAHWAEKLFHYFIDKYNPDYVISFSDITKHSGWLYNSLGFKLESISGPSYWRVDKDGIPHWRRSCQKQSMHNLPYFNHDYKYLEHKEDPFWQQSETQLMEGHWYVKVYDAWMRKHIWYNSSCNIK